MTSTVALVSMMRTAGRLGSASIALRGGDFSPGDAVVTKLNHLRAGVVNGERGTVVAVDAVRGSLEVDLSGRRVVLGADYLAAETQSGGPSLLHGYAITGHAAQGLTTERAFVLGSDDSYREWGYAALSRGSAANHLYVVPDQAERNEFAPQDRRTRDPLASIHRALEGSRAQRDGDRRRDTRSRPTNGARGSLASWRRSRASATRRKPNSGERLGPQARLRGRTGGPAASTARAALRRRRWHAASLRFGPRSDDSEASSELSTETRRRANATRAAAELTRDR